MSFRWDRADTLRFKGLGILLIVLHNFFHLVRELPRENEFEFSQAYADAFWRMLIDSPGDGVRILSSFVGHFGVQVFIFLSAYGLTRKFMAGPQSLGAFMASRYRKIYPVFAMAAGLWLLKIAVFSGPGAAAERLFSKDLLFVVLGVSNVIPGQALRPVGPWWFISFIFQFYAVYPLLYFYSQKFGGKGLLWLGAGGIVVMAAFNDAIRGAYGVNLYYTFVAHLPELCLGVHLAQRREAIAYPGAILAGAGIVFVLGCVYPGWWYLNPISALVLLIGLDAFLKRVVPDLLIKVLMFYGTISLPLFLVNAYLREPVLGFARQELRAGVVILYAVLYLAIATATATASAIMIGERFGLARLKRDFKTPDSVFNH
jgi:peptidoglycan/LPS O-acetylase OafA/YrhL